jgi:hypothetical protein
MWASVIIHLSRSLRLLLHSMPFIISIISWFVVHLSNNSGGMGFRDFHSFNKALLAKQSWRLWRQPESLVGQIMEGKYYSGSTILEARVGKSPSFAWRSIQGACDLLKEGLVWRVGNGKKARIWKDRWLPTPSTYQISSPPVLLDEDATVGALVDNETLGWKNNLLVSLFTAD